MLLGLLRSCCKPLCPQLPTKTRVLLAWLKVLMDESQQELGVNNYFPHPHGKLLQPVVQVLSSSAKTQML